MTQPRFVVAGAGLAGSLMAVYLARRGYPVDVVERRSDPRSPGAADEGRSINLGMSQRALQALSDVGLLEELLPSTVPMRGRAIHRADGRLVFQPYGTTESEILHSILRRDLNLALLRCAADLPGVHLHFGRRLAGLTDGGVLVTDPGGAETMLPADAVVGADGAFSAVRAAIHAAVRADLHVEYLPWGYKELTIPVGSDGAPRTRLEALHVWPARAGLIVAHPNRDGSLTGTVFLPHEGPDSFATLRDPAAIRDYFAGQHPDTLDLMPDLVAEFQQHPVGNLVTVRSAPWRLAGRAVLIGDAAHAVYPFYGQGMNAAFEDCTTLDRCLGQHPGDLAAAFAEFEQRRRPHTDVLAELSRLNFGELRDGVRSPLFLARRRADLVLNRLFPRAWRPLYTMVSHTTIPYADALARSRRQDRLLRGSAAAVAAAGAAGTLGRRRRHREGPC